MKKNAPYFFALALVMMITASCKRELLDPQPEAFLTDLNAFDRPDRIANQVLGLYSSLKNGNFYGGRYLVYGDIRGEDFLNATNNLITNVDVWNFSASSSATSVTTLWTFGYRTINFCNVFLDGMEAKGTSVVGTALSNRYIAEARLIRGLSYYSLLQYYARPYADGNGSKPGLPLRLTGIKTSGSSDLARSSVAEVYAQVLSDLNFAEANLPLTSRDTTASSNSLTNVTRAQRNTAIALKTRVYLSMQKYADVITEANKIVSSTAPFMSTTGVQHRLAPDITAIFKPPYVSYENIFSLPFTTTTGDAPGTQNGLQSYYFSSPTGTGSEFYLNNNGIIADPNWKATDKRRSFIYTNATNPNNIRRYLNKFATGAPADFVPVIRYAEVLLNLAEAKTRVSNTVDPQALALLNEVRTRSDPTTVYTAANLATATDLINAILMERRIEFLGEGLRNNDIMRLLQTFPAKGAAPAKGPADEGYTWPASADEKSLNKLWVD
jgi:hypothetical protein